MKSFLLQSAFAALVLAISAGLLPAQDPVGDPRKRLVFPTGSGEPIVSATATPAPAAVKSETPSSTITAFFLALKSGQVDAAYESLIRNTVISEKPENVNELKARTKQALDSYGPVAGFETIGTLEAGKNLLRFTCISLNEDLPLRWRFYFYKGPSGWKLVDLRVDDGLVELFEEVARQQPK